MWLLARVWRMAAQQALRGVKRSARRSKSCGSVCSIACAPRLSSCLPELRWRPPFPPSTHKPPLQANAPAYYAVDTSRALGSQLAGKTLVEFPVMVRSGQMAGAQGGGGAWR